jgi:hypothetical protein
MAEDAPTVPVPGPSEAARLQALWTAHEALERALADADGWLQGHARQLAAEGALRTAATRQALQRVTSGAPPELGDAALGAPGAVDMAELRAAGWQPVDVSLLGAPRRWRDPASERVLPWTRALGCLRRDRTREGGHEVTVEPAPGEDQSA